MTLSVGRPFLVDLLLYCTQAKDFLLSVSFSAGGGVRVVWCGVVWYSVVCVCVCVSLCVRACVCVCVCALACVPV